MSGRADPHVVVIKGGLSAEREVSVSSGTECTIALRDAGFNVTELDVGLDIVPALQAANPDVVFNALHGRWGEDGCVQGILEWLRIPYTHSGVLASALAMDKQRSKDAMAAIGLPIVESVIVDRDVVASKHVLAPPYVVKPNNEGSSVGVYIVHEAANSPPKLSDDMPSQVMVETYAPGRELTVSVFQDRAFTVSEIHTEGWYDYDAKYTEGGSHHTLPADIPSDIFDACMDQAVKAHNALGCKGVSRTDFRWDDTKGLAGLIILEVNTQPGMTPTSLVPEQALHVGYSFAEFCKLLVEDASCDR